VKYLAVSTNTADPTPYLAEENAQVEDLRASGVLERLLLKADRSGAVILLQADDEGAAHAALSTLPLVAHGITSFAVTAVLDPADLG